MKPYPKLLEEEYQVLTDRLDHDQNGACAREKCKIMLRDGEAPQIAHRIVKARIRALLGDKYMWDHRCVGLVCSLDCNNRLALGKGTQPELELAERILQEDGYDA